jgi:hypothetical protein
MGGLGQIPGVPAAYGPLFGVGVAAALGSFPRALLSMFGGSRVVTTGVYRVVRE